MFSVCEFCGQEKEVGDPTPFHGSYCADCMGMNIEYDKESIAKMKPSKKKKITEETLKKLKHEKDLALNDLINFNK